MNPLKELGGQGQSIWLDYIRRNLIRSGELKRMVEDDGIRGVTSNPTIFEKAIAGSTDYPQPFACAIARDNVFAVQFHPEKSGADGLTLLQNFVTWQPAARLARPRQLAAAD